MDFLFDIIAATQMWFGLVFHVMCHKKNLWMDAVEASKRKRENRRFPYGFFVFLLFILSKFNMEPENDTKE